MMSAGKHKISDWYLPPDWRFLLGWHVIMIPLGIIATVFVVALKKASQGDTSLLAIALVIGILGTAMLFLARLPLYRQHKYLSIGPRGLSERHRKLYWLSYGFIGTSIAILLSILLTLS